MVFIIILETRKFSSNFLYFYVKMVYKNTLHMENKELHKFKDGDDEADVKDKKEGNAKGNVDKF